MTDVLCRQGHVISPGRQRCERCNGLPVSPLKWQEDDEILPTSTPEEAGKVDGGEDTAAPSPTGSDAAPADPAPAAPESAPADAPAITPPPAQDTGTAPAPAEPAPLPSAAPDTELPPAGVVAAPDPSSTPTAPPQQ